MHLVIRESMFIYVFTFPFFSQVICGSGSPVTLQESSKGCPSLTSVSTRRVEKSGGHMASSGDTRKKNILKINEIWFGSFYYLENKKLHLSSLVELRDLDGLPTAFNLLPYFFMLFLSVELTVYNLKNYLMFLKLKQACYYSKYKSKNVSLHKKNDYI